MLQERYKYLVYKLKQLNYSISEIHQLDIVTVHEQILYGDFDNNIKKREQRLIHNVKVKDDKYFNEFFDSYNRYFRIEIPRTPVKEIKPKQLLKKG